jgi:microsomal dipeptidase-like Zn-dependent dipeptidase
MVVHIVSFKYRPEVNAKARQEHRAKLEALADIDGILDLKVGEDFVRSPRSYDTGLVVSFRDRAALDGYARHSRHEPVAKLGRDLSDTIVAVDFDA